MSVAGARVTVTSSATLIAQGGSDDSSPVEVLIYNPVGGLTINLGASTVTYGTGVELIGGNSVSLKLKAGELIYGIASSTSQVVQVLTEDVG